MLHNNPIKITALTSFCVDFFPEIETTYVGGNSLNFATQCKLLNQPNISVIGAIGKDTFGELIQQHLHSHTINTSRVYASAEPTASNKIFIDNKKVNYLLFFNNLQHF